MLDGDVYVAPPLFSVKIQHELRVGEACVRYGRDSDRPGMGSRAIPG